MLLITVKMVGWALFKRTKKMKINIMNKNKIFFLLLFLWIPFFVANTNAQTSKSQTPTSLSKFPPVYAGIDESCSTRNKNTTPTTADAGTYDTSFGEAGALKIGEQCENDRDNGTNYCMEEVFDIIIGDNCKLLVGYADGNTLSGNVYVAKYDLNGSPQGSFGASGWVTLPTFHMDEPQTYLGSTDERYPMNGGKITVRNEKLYVSGIAYSSSITASYHGYVEALNYSDGSLLTDYGFHGGALTVGTQIYSRAWHAHGYLGGIAVFSRNYGYTGTENQISLLSPSGTFLYSASLDSKINDEIHSIHQASGISANHSAVFYVTGHHYNEADFSTDFVVVKVEATATGATLTQKLSLSSTSSIESFYDKNTDELITISWSNSSGYKLYNGDTLFYTSESPLSEVEGISAMARTENGEIYLAGYSEITESETRRIYLIKLKSDGSIDTDFAQKETPGLRGTGISGNKPDSGMAGMAPLRSGVFSAIVTGQDKYQNDYTSGYQPVKMALTNDAVFLATTDNNRGVVFKINR